MSGSTDCCSEAQSVPTIRRHLSSARALLLANVIKPARPVPILARDLVIRILPFRCSCFPESPLIVPGPSSDRQTSIDDQILSRDPRALVTGKVDGSRT